MTPQSRKMYIISCGRFVRIYISYICTLFTCNTTIHWLIIDIKKDGKKTKQKSNPECNAIRLTAPAVVPMCQNWGQAQGLFRDNKVILN